MDNFEFEKRIEETIWDIYPLDKILPIETVYSIFIEEYKKQDNKSIYFKERKYQRMREGFFSIFVAISLKHNSVAEQYLIFPSNKSQDVLIGSPNKLNEKELIVSPYDIKEFTIFSKSFFEFVDNVIKPKLGIYNLVIATHREINKEDFEYLIDLLKKEKSSAQVWLLGAPNEGEENLKATKVTILNSEGIIYQKTFDLDDWLDFTKPIIIYHDTLKLK